MGRSRVRPAAVWVVVSAVVVLGLAGGQTQAATEYTCFGQPATIVGTDGDDDLGDTPGVDVIYAGAGDDWVGAGNDAPDRQHPSVGDLVCGGPGNDVLGASTASNDQMSGGDGDDWIQGGWGSIFLGSRAMTASTTWRTSTGRTGTTQEPTSSGAGAVTTRSRARCGSDKAYGGGGADHVEDWTAASSYLRGGAGKDYLEAWRAEPAGDGPRMSDFVSGGRGVDTAKANRLDKVTASTEMVTYVRPG